MDIKYRKAFAEVLDVLEHTDRTLVRKIPREFMEFLRQNADMTHGVIFDSSKKLKEQAISKEAKEILAMIYEDYMNKTKMQNNMKESTNEKLLKIFKNKIGGEK
jgi:hypothetical protein